MLVQKRGVTKSTKKLLIILGIIIVLGGGYFAYDSFTSKSNSNTDDSLLSGSVSVIKQVKTDLDTDIFEDPQFQNLSRDKYEGFVNQSGVISLSEDTPIPITQVMVKNPEIGESLIVFWKMPEYINFDKVLLYRSTTPGQLGEMIYEVDANNYEPMQVDSYNDQNLKNGQKYYYYVESVIGSQLGDETNESNPISITQISNNQIWGTPMDNEAPSAPQNILVVANSDGNIEISWINSADDDIKSINIYRSEIKGSLGNLLHVALMEKIEDYTRDGQDRLFYIDEAIKENTSYYYTLTTSDYSGNESSTNVLAAPYKSYYYNPFQPLDY